MSIMRQWASLTALLFVFYLIGLVWEARYPGDNLKIGPDWQRFEQVFIHLFR